MRTLYALAAALVLAACASTPPPTPAYRLIDLSDDYLALYDRTEGLPPEQRVAAFSAEITPLFPDFYGKARYPNMTQERYDARIARSFERFAAIRGAYQNARTSFVANLDPAIASFVEIFPDMGAIGDIHLLHSLGEMDGGTREFDGRHYFVFGADVMAQVHTPGAARPFFHHELFHVYHAQNFTEACEPVWCGLWSEGVAVLAAIELNPDATDAQLLLTAPEPIRPAVDANLTEAVCAVRARLDSQDSADANALFSFQRLNERLPPRFGYYVGYLAAREVRRTHSLRDMAHMSATESRTAIEQALEALATCE